MLTPFQIQKVNRNIQGIIGVQGHEIVPSKNLKTDFAADSLDVLDLEQSLEDDFNIRLSKLNSNMSVQDVYDAVQEAICSGSRKSM